MNGTILLFSNQVFVKISCDLLECEKFCHSIYIEAINYQQISQEKIYLTLQLFNFTHDWFD